MGSQPASHVTDTNGLGLDLNAIEDIEQWLGLTCSPLPQTRFRMVPVFNMVTLQARIEKKCIRPHTTI